MHAKTPASGLVALVLSSPLLVIAAVTLWRLAAAWGMPVIQDEAYYYDWSHALAWGYFDHPPAVALLGLGGVAHPGSALAARLGALLVGTLTLIALWRFYRDCGLQREPMLTLSILLAAATFPGLISGVLTTPDTVLALCWVLALHQALLALHGQRWRWLTAGAATGAGLLGKYTMLMIGPVFLIALIAADRRALRSPWPYLGGLVALALFLPNLVWNAQNDWLALRFQLGHGFATDTGAVSLPADALLGVAAPAAGEHANTTPLTSEQRVAGIGSFVLVQLLFWGLPLLAAVAAPFAWSRWLGSLAEFRRCMAPRTRALLIAATLVPLVLFGFIAATGSVEPNWAALYIVGAAPLLAAWVRPLAGWAVAGAAANMLLLGLYALHAATAALPLPGSADRILRESGGYSQLAKHVADQHPEALFTDRYQTAAMLNFYGTGTRATQWPGLTRPSEYGLGRIAPLPDPARLRETGFTLVAWKYAVPKIAGYRIAEAETLYHCRGLPLHVVPDIGWPDASPCGEDWLHIWRVLHYEPKAKRESKSKHAQPGNKPGNKPGKEPANQERGDG